MKATRQCACGPSDKITYRNGTWYCDYCGGVFRRAAGTARRGKPMEIGFRPAPGFPPGIQFRAERKRPDGMRFIRDSRGRFAPHLGNNGEPIPLETVEERLDRLNDQMKDRQ